MFDLMIFRSLIIGLNISVDYKYSLWNLDDESDEYNTAIRGCHRRAAERILEGCLKNGGLYIKLGQVSKCILSNTFFFLSQCLKLQPISSITFQQLPIKGISDCCKLQLAGSGILRKTRYTTL